MKLKTFLKSVLKSKETSSILKDAGIDLNLLSKIDPNGVQGRVIGSVLSQISGLLVPNLTSVPLIPKVEKKDSVSRSG